MKVISQLIRHFWQSGALDEHDAEYLLRHGFARPRDLPGYRPHKAKSIAPVAPPPELENAAVELPSPLETIEEVLVLRAAARYRGATPRKTPDIEPLRGRVRALLKQRSAKTRILMAVARPFGEPKNWTEAVALLRGVPTSRLRTSLAAMLEQRPTALDELWAALDPDPFLLLAQDPAWKGAAINAFGALLIASSPKLLGRYKWIVRHVEFKTICNLLMVWRSMLHALGGLYEQDRAVVWRSVQASHNPMLFWGSVLVYNAKSRDGGADGRPREYGLREYGPLDLPTYDVWRQAWSAALTIDHGRLSRFFVECYGSSTTPSADALGCCQVPLMCPDGWREPADSGSIS